MKIVETFIKGSKDSYCEDALYVCDKFAFLLDGATCIADNITECETDAVWFVNEWKKFLIEALKENKDLINILNIGTSIIYKKYMSYPGADKKEDKPSSSISIIRERENYLEYYTLMDSVILLRMKNGKTIYLIDNRLQNLDDINLNILKSIAKRKGKKINECLPEIYPYILENRKKMNTPFGYGALSLSTDGLNTAIQGKFNLTEIKDIMLFSDGFAESYDLFGIYKNSFEIIECVSNNDLNNEVNRLLSEQNKDPYCEKYIRNKKTDDISIIYVSFENT